MVRRFKRIEGKVIEKIPGQDRLAFAMSGTEDFYDLIAWSRRGGYQGSVILFYDIKNGEVYQPFEKKRNVVYGNPVFSDGFYYFLQGDYDENRITLYKYLPWIKNARKDWEKGRRADEEKAWKKDKETNIEKVCKKDKETNIEKVCKKDKETSIEKVCKKEEGKEAETTAETVETDEENYCGQILQPVTCFRADEMDLYNLRIIGDQVHVISQNETFRCYYPERISFDLDSHETVCFMEEGKVYIEAWVEEGWDEENECATDEYRYYDKVIIKDYSGRLLSEETGSLFQAPDGTWWIS